MRARLAILLGLALLALIPASADAFRWHMRYSQAKHASRVYAIEACEEISECTSFAIGECRRRSLGRFDCEIAIFAPGTEIEIECNQRLHWGVRRGGYIALKGRGKPDCFSIES